MKIKFNDSLFLLLTTPYFLFVGCSSAPETKPQETTNIPILYSAEPGFRKCGHGFKQWADVTHATHEVDKKAGISVVRATFLDLYIPENTAALEVTNCHDIILSTAITKNPAELPLQLNYNGKALTKIGCSKESYKDPRIAQEIGPHFQTCFFLIEDNVLIQGGNLTADFAINRKDFLIAHEDPKKPLECKAPKKSPDKEVLKRIIKREFCLDL